MPTSIAVPPDATMPARTAAASPEPDGRLSRPTARTGARPSFSQPAPAYARPSAWANSGVSSFPMIPRTSYSRKIERGTFISAACHGCDGWRDRARGPECDVHDPARQDAQDDHPDEAHGYNECGAARQVQPAVGRLGVRRLHVHGHDHRQIVSGRDYAGHHEDHGKQVMRLPDGRLQDVPLSDAA